MSDIFTVMHGRQYTVPLLNSPSEYLQWSCGHSPLHYQCLSWIKDDSWLFVHCMSEWACVSEWVFNVGTLGFFFFFFAVYPGVENEVEGDAVTALLKQQATAAPATDNTTQAAVEQEITYPSRLIYYLNEDTESTYHDLDTRVKNQDSEGQVRHFWITQKFTV